MFRTKSEVDKHAGRLLMRIQDQSDRNKESLKIARLYFDINELREASFYLSNYLSEFSLDPYAWQLQGDICQRSDRNYLKAIEYYSKSFEFGNSTDKNLLLKICDCYLKMTEKFDEKKATDWLIKAEEAYKTHKIVIDLKEKLLNMNSDSQNGEIKNHEAFLISLLNENLLDEELHLKLIKIYLKSSQIGKAVNYLAKIEYKQIFSNQSWYKSVIDEIEATLTRISDDEKQLLVSILTILLFRQLKSTLQTTDDTNSYFEIFLKLDKYISMLEKFSQCKRLIQQIKSEQLAQFHFILGLLLNMQNSDPEIGLNENRTKLAALACFLKSSMISKPNSFASDDTNESNDLLRLVERESALRYSIIGNWILFIVAKFFGDDQLEFFEHIYKFSADNDVKSIINDSLNLDKKLSESQESSDSSYIKNLKNEFFRFDTDKLIVFDHLTLSLADKLTMEYQTFKLRYLVWYCLINTKFVKSAELGQIPPYFFFRSSSKKNSKKHFSKIAFGVNNLNICNIESLSQLDLKIFLYLVYYQSLSYVINNESSFLLQPFYHVQTNRLCSEKQENWWFQMTTKLFESSSSSSPRKVNFLEMPIDEPIRLNLDSKKKKELGCILELIRLKSYSVKIDSHTRYEQNLSVCAHLAKYLQFLSDCISANPQVTREENTIRSLAIEQETIECSPKEKLEFVEKFLSRYSSFVQEQTHKMKQIERLSLNESVIDEVNHFVNYYGSIEQPIETNNEETEENKAAENEAEKTNELEETEFETVIEDEDIEIEPKEEEAPEEVKPVEPVVEVKETEKPLETAIETKLEEVKITTTPKKAEQNVVEKEEVKKPTVTPKKEDQKVEEIKSTEPVKETPPKEIEKPSPQKAQVAIQNEPPKLEAELPSIGPNKSIMSLIEILKNQKSSQNIQMSIDTLKEQFDIIRSQYKQINQEIRLLNKVSVRPNLQY